MTPRSRWRFIAPVLIIAVVFAVFWPSLLAGYVIWDDDDLLLKNTHHRAFTGENLRWMFTTSFFGHYQPLTWLSYALDYAVWKGDPLGYHLTNVVLHALTAVGFYFVARRLLALADRRDVDRMTSPYVLGATFSAILFAAHPLRAESVAWLAERRDVLSGAFYMLSIACYVRYATSSEAKNRATFYVMAIIACMLSLFSKAIGMSMFVVLLILDIYPLRRIDAKNWTRGTAPTVWLEKLPFAALGGIFAWRALVAQAVRGNTLSVEQHDWPARIAQACYGTVFYLWKTVWPTHIGPLYEIPERSVLLGPQLWGSVIVLAGLTCFLILFRRRVPGLIAALAAYLVIVSPVLGFAQSGPQLVADRYSYIPCMGFAVCAGWWVIGNKARGNKATRQEAKGNDIIGSGSSSALLPSCLVASCLVLCVATYRQAGLWGDPIRLWAHAVRVSPDSPIAQCNYADALSRAKRFAEAFPVYQRALQLNPKDAVALHHMGDLHLETKQADGAIEYYRKTIAVNPNRKGVHFMLARLLMAKEQWNEALVVLRDGAQRHPQELEMLDCLADMLATYPDPAVRNGKEAVIWASKASAARVNKHAPFLLTLATAWAEAGRFDEAVSTAQQAIAIAEQSGAAELAAELRRRLKLFQEGKPYHFGD